MAEESGGDTLDAACNSNIDANSVLKPTVTFDSQAVPSPSINDAPSVPRPSMRIIRKSTSNHNMAQASADATLSPRKNASKSLTPAQASADSSSSTRKDRSKTITPAQAPANSSAGVRKQRAIAEVDREKKSMARRRWTAARRVMTNETNEDDRLGIVKNYKRMSAFEPVGMMETVETTGKNLFGEYLKAIQKNDVMLHLSLPCQIGFSRQLRKVEVIHRSDAPVVLLEAHWNQSEQRKLLFLDEGEVDIIIPATDDADERIIARMERGAILGAFFGMGLSSSHLFTFRTADREKRSRKSSVQKNEHAFKIYSVAIEHMIGLERKFSADFVEMRKGILDHTRQSLMPYLKKLVISGFFKGYSPNFIQSILGLLNLRVIRKGAIIFEERTHASNLCVLITGQADIYVSGKHVGVMKDSGHCFGEMALLFPKAVRASTVRCSEKQDCVIAVVRRDDFLSTLRDFPENMVLLEKQANLAMAHLTFLQTFRGCRSDFLWLLACKCAIGNLRWSQEFSSAMGDLDQESAMLLCCQGQMVVNDEGSDAVRKIHRGMAINAEGGFALPPMEKQKQKISGGLSGCVVAHIPYKAIEEACRFLPGQFDQMMLAMGVEIPPGISHPFDKVRNNLHEYTAMLLSKALQTFDITVDMMKELEEFVTVASYDTSRIITEQGQIGGRLVMLLQGTVTWSTRGMFSTSLSGPQHFHGLEFLGVISRHATEVTALTPCVICTIPSRIGAICAKRYANEVNPDHSKLKASELLAQKIEMGAVRRKAERDGYLSRLKKVRGCDKLKPEILDVFVQQQFFEVFEQNSFITQGGKPGDVMYFLMEGKANGKNKKYEEGDKIGTEILRGVNYTKTVKATTLCKCSVIPKDIAKYVCESFPEETDWREFWGHPKLRSQASMTTEDAAKSQFDPALRQVMMMRSGANDLFLRDCPKPPPASRAAYPEESAFDFELPSMRNSEDEPPEIDIQRLKSERRRDLWHESYFTPPLALKRSAVKRRNDNPDAKYILSQMQQAVQSRLPKQECDLQESPDDMEAICSDSNTLFGQGRSAGSQDAMQSWESLPHNANSVHVTSWESLPHNANRVHVTCPRLVRTTESTRPLETAQLMDNGRIKLPRAEELEPWDHGDRHLSWQRQMVGGSLNEWRAFHTTLNEAMVGFFPVVANQSNFGHQ